MPSVTTPSRRRIAAQRLLLQQQGADATTAQKQQHPPTSATAAGVGQKPPSLSTLAPGTSHPSDFITLGADIPRSPCHHDTRNKSETSLTVAAVDSCHLVSAVATAANSDGNLPATYSALHRRVLAAIGSQPAAAVTGLVAAQDGPHTAADGIVVVCNEKATGENSSEFEANGAGGPVTEAVAGTTVKCRHMAVASSTVLLSHAPEKGAIDNRESREDSADTMTDHSSHKLARGLLGGTLTVGVAQKMVPASSVGGVNQPLVAIRPVKHTADACTTPPVAGTSGGISATAPLIDNGCLASTQEVVLSGGLRLRLGLKRLQSSRPWPHWSLQLMDSDGLTIQLGTVDESGQSHLTAFVTPSIAPSCFRPDVNRGLSNIVSEQEAAADSGVHLRHCSAGGLQSNVTQAKLLRAFGGHRDADRELTRSVVQSQRNGVIDRLAAGGKWASTGSDTSGLTAGDSSVRVGPAVAEGSLPAAWSQSMTSTPQMAKRRRDSELDPWSSATATTSDESMSQTACGPVSTGPREAWYHAAADGNAPARDSDFTDSAEAVTTGANHLAPSAAAAIMAGSVISQQQQSQQLSHHGAGADILGASASSQRQHMMTYGLQSPYGLPAHHVAAAAAIQAARSSSMMPLGQAAYMLTAGHQYASPLTMHPQFGGPMLHPLAAVHAQRGLMMPAVPQFGVDRPGLKHLRKHGLDDIGGYESAEERNFTEAEKKRLQEAPWPEKKRPTGLPTLYCHLCYLREGVFRVVSAISPNPDTVYFRHQQCHTSFKRGEDLPKSIVAQYQAWYKKRALANQHAAASRVDLSALPRTRIRLDDDSPVTPRASANDR